VRGRTIEDVLVRSVSVLKTVDPPITALRGARIVDVRRRGKYLLFDLDPPLTLVMHLRRNGRLKSVPRPDGRQARGGRAPAGAWGGRDLALIVRLDGETDLVMIEMGPKKSASVWLCRAGTEIAGPLAGLGVEPLSPQFTPEALGPMLRSERMRLKPFLLLQRHVVGIGNAYADEILWEARLSPQAMTSALRDGEISALHGAIVSTLERAVEGHRRELGDALPMAEPPGLLSVHRHGGEPCPRCGTPIAVIFYEDRETYYCPACQAGGRVYADRRRSRLLR
jgi:formamidopyrimidine-DNA glycosylase